MEKTKVISIFLFYFELISLEEKMKYKNYLKNIKGYSDHTTSIYVKYAVKLELLNLDYEKLMSKYSKVSNNTRRVILSAIKKYLKFLGNDVSQIELPKKDVVVMPYVGYEEYVQYTKEINRKTKMGLKKLVVLRILFETGIRSSELLNILKEDIDEQQIKIRGKGKRERYVHISKWLKNDLDEYLSSKKGKKVFDFGYKNLYQKIASLNKNKKITPHMLRRGFANYCNQKLVPLYDISISMGHSNINTTAGYINKNSGDINLSEIFN